MTPPGGRRGNGLTQTAPAPSRRLIPRSNNHQSASTATPPWVQLYVRSNPTFDGISHMAARAFADDGPALLRARRTCVQERRRAPRVSRNEWCERVTTALEVGRMLALTDSALARLARGASRIRRRARSRWLEDIGQAGSVGS